ncbi:MAG: GNAT family N-acetyltransferase [Porphyromonadaceae bacterium]|nr:GNAT family N-acetyltransferase [Porphyromonadaceae bacterium]
MIQYADDSTKQQVWDMWKIVFGDPDNYMEVYFRHKYRNEQTLLYMEGEKAVASLQMLPYQFTFCGTEIPVIYLSGVCTLPEARKKGYARLLLIRSLEEARLKGVPLILLVPQEKWLLRFYDKFGFAKTFDEGIEALPSLKELTERSPGDLHAAYRTFDECFRQKDMTLQKTYDDFLAMVEEAMLFDFPQKKKLSGMARVIDAERLCDLFAGRYEQQSFTVVVEDQLIQENNDTLTILHGKANRNNFIIQPLLHTDIRELTQLLLGYRTSELEEPLRTIFQEKQPGMHFMLE